MKKIIVLLLAVVLVVAGLGGFVYAQDISHEPMIGQKLVGQGAYGPDPPDTLFDAAFTITNPDCVSEITIDQLSIISGDGTVIYEGPLLQRDGTPWEGPMTPHEIRGILLSDFFTEPPVHAMAYTVEIFWTGSHKMGLPLMGMAYHILDDPNGGGTATTQMVNMEQVLKNAK